MHPEIVIPIIHKLKTLQTIGECEAFHEEFRKYEAMLDPKEVSRVKQEILTQMMKIKIEQD